jgi:hypothetical protein
MTERVLVTIHLPVGLGCAAEVMAAVSERYPDARVRLDTACMEIKADPDLTMAQRRAILRERRKAVTK